MVLLGLGLAVVPSCVELASQRIFWFYDVAKDEIQILICYDGIHEADSILHQEWGRTNLGLATSHHVGRMAPGATRRER